MPVDHFTPWDYNYPYGPPDGATSPPGPDGDGGDESKKRPCSAGGSIILCDTQTLQETLPVTGTPLTMRYSSDAVPGRLSQRQLKIRLKDGRPVGPLRDISVEIGVAGRTFYESLPASTPNVYTFTWDGLDANGEPVIGQVMASVTVGYGYQFVYKSPSEFGNAFAGFGIGTLFSRGGSTPAFRPGSSYVERSYTAAIGVQDLRPQGQGGWSFDQVHHYNAEQKQLLLGDGTTVSAGDPLATTIETVAGAGYEGYAPATGQAKEEPLGTVRGLASGPDGTVYLSLIHI